MLNVLLFQLNHLIYITKFWVIIWLFQLIVISGYWKKLSAVFWLIMSTRCVLFPPCCHLVILKHDVIRNNVKSSDHKTGNEIKEPDSTPPPLGQIWDGHFGDSSRHRRVHSARSFLFHRRRKQGTDPGSVDHRRSFLAHGLRQNWDEGSEAQTAALLRSDLTTLPGACAELCSALLHF